MRVRLVLAVVAITLPFANARGDEKKLPEGAVAKFRVKGYQFAQHGLPIAVSPDGKFLAMGSPGVEATLVNLADKETVETFKGSDGTIDAVAFSKDGKLLFSAGDEGLVWVWDLESKKKLREMKHGGPIRALAVDASGKYVASAGQGPLKIWEVKDGSLHQRFEGNESHLTSVAFAPDGNEVAAGSSDHTLHVWSVKDRKSHRTFAGGQAIVSSVAYSRDGRFLITGSWDQRVRLLSAATLKDVSDLFGSENPPQPGAIGLPMPEIKARVHCVACSPDGQTIAFGSEDKKVRLCELATRKVFMELEGHDGGVSHLAFTPDGRGLISSGKELNVYLWDLTKNAKIESAELKPEEIDALWSKLKDTDARVAYGAFFKLLLTPKNALPLLKEHLKPADAVKEERIQQLIAKLDADQFDVREKATQDLETLDEQAEALVRKKLAGDLPNVEIRRRLERILQKIENRGANGEQVRMLRAVRMLEWINQPESRKLLESLAKGAEGSQLTRAARSALTRLPKPQP